MANVCLPWSEAISVLHPPVKVGAMTTMLELADKVATEADAYRWLEELRWPYGVQCPHCHGTEVALMVPKNGVSRKTTNGSMTQRRVWQCRPCRKQFSAISGTVMHGTKASVRVWCMVIFQMIGAKNGISAREVSRQHGICPRTAWFMLHRIRETMRTDPLISTMQGIIVADETYVGGTPANRHRSAPGATSKAGRGTEKTPIMSLIHARTGEVRSRVMPTVDSTNVAKVLSEHVNIGGSVLWTDEGSWFKPVGRQFLLHETVNHAQDEYVGPIGQTINRAENYFSQFKRSLDGTFHHVSKEHLQRYVDEFDFRYTTCKASDTERMGVAVRRGDGKRLTYKRVKRFG